MCTEDQHREKMQALTRIENYLKRQDQLPNDQTVQISDTQGWQMDYRGYKHVFMWCPTSLTLVLGEYGTGPVQAQVWINLGMKMGIKIFTSGQASPVPVVLRFTNEVIP